MNFVDDFRRIGDRSALVDPFDVKDDRAGALLASTAESLCDEMNLPPPEWLSEVPAAVQPYFVSGLENLKAISLVESPLRFRVRKIFVLENFLNRA
ncbi:MAG: hypothetical protein ACR2IH_08290 [Pyrinomonadaceae bacterium]